MPGAPEAGKGRRGRRGVNQGCSGRDRRPCPAPDAWRLMFPCMRCWPAVTRCNCTPWAAQPLPGRRPGSGALSGAVARARHTLHALTAAPQVGICVCASLPSASFAPSPCEQPRGDHASFGCLQPSLALERSFRIVAPHCTFEAGHLQTNRRAAAPPPRCASPGAASAPRRAPPSPEPGEQQGRGLCKAGFLPRALCRAQEQLGSGARAACRPGPDIARGGGGRGGASSRYSRRRVVHGGARTGMLTVIRGRAQVSALPARGRCGWACAGWGWGVPSCVGVRSSPWHPR